jgi:hypothetical protein
MQSFFQWLSTRPGGLDKPWLVLGKGPSFARRSAFDLSAHHLLSLNHVVRELPVQAAHAIDLDVVDECAEALLGQAEVLVMPWVPHVANRPGSRTLAEIVPAHPVLTKLEAEGRLVWYNLSTAKGVVAPGSPVVQARFFSAEAAIDLLARAGARTIRSLGVDGGTAYAPDFEDLTGKTLLANGRPSFNRQFEGIAETILATGVDFAPLDMPSPVRVYVAATESELVPTQVLAYSIRKHASLSVEVMPLCAAELPMPVPKAPQNQPRTPFSFQRFLIPALTGHRGRAIYMDSDMQVFRDIRALWTQPMGDADLLAVGDPGDSGRKPQFSVMLLDCERLRWDLPAIVAQLDSGALSYEQLMYEMAVAEHVRGDIPPSWNSLERYEAGETALLHYTDMNTQPWVSTANPLGYLWVGALLEAIALGQIDRALVDDHLDRGYLRPSLRHQLDHGLADPLLLPRPIKALDHGFQAPFTQLPRHGASPWANPGLWARAMVREAYHRSPLYALERRLRNRLP